jgi:beta-lactamase class A
MRSNRRTFSPITIFSLLALLAAIVLLVLQLITFSRVRATFPQDLRVANLPAGGLDRQEVASRLLQLYSVPVELRYGENRIQLDPSVVDFTLDNDSMLAAANLARTETNFWVDFWDYLWQRSSTGGNVPLSSSYSEQRLRTYLINEVASRYDQPPVPAVPAPGTTNFLPGEPGTVLDVDRAVALIENALRSTNNRIVDLPLQRTDPPRPSLDNLEILLKQTIAQSGFDGLSAVYMLDLQTAQEIYFIDQQGEDLPTNPDLSFTGSSIIKIPIMVSAFRRIVDTQDEETMNLVFLMIDRSGNEAADWLMDRVITTGALPGPLGVTADMQTLGLENTFLAGYFYAGAPLLQSIQTPGNNRTDVNTSPDIYNQTSPAEIGMLLADIYHCATQGGGGLVAAFPGEITQEECQQMIDYLSLNQIGVLIEAGAPDGTKIAHKHGWVSDIYATIRTIGDAGIVYTPGGNYVLVTFVSHPEQLIWDQASSLIAELSRAVYNYYNLPQ